jgi:hypothetical protein
MLTIEQIKERLRPYNLRAVSEETGIKYNRLYWTISGRKKNVNYADVVILSAWLEHQND